MLGIFLRLYNLDKIYTEYDDVGVISLHKSLASDQREVHLYKDDILKLDVVVASKGLKDNLLDTAWYPVYLGYSWTYPVGQYLLYPLIISEKDSYLQKIKKSRLVSAVFSILSLFLLLYILYLLNDNKIDKNILLPVSLLAVSYNSILYAHHASPYSLTVTTFLISLICYIFYYKNKINTTFFFVFHALLVIFNYLILILIPIYTVIMIIHDKNYNIVYLSKKFFKGFLLFGIIFLPIFILFFKSSKGLHGAMPPDEFSLEYLMYFPKQFIVAASSSVQGLFIFDNITIFVISLILLYSFYSYYKFYFKTKNLNNLIFIFVFLLSLEWILLHSIGKIIMDQTRHMLMWAPIISILFFYVIKDLKIHISVLLIASLVLNLYGSYNNIKIINSKKSVIDFNDLSKYNEKIVFSYAFTLAPLIGIENKKVYNIDVNSFNKDIFKEKLPNKVLLISQSESIKDYLKRKDLNIFTKNLLQKYSIEVIKEIDSGIYFSYNNYPVSSTKNGIFLYKLKLKG